MDVQKELDIGKSAYVREGGMLSDGSAIMMRYNIVKLCSIVFSNWPAIRLRNVIFGAL